MRTQVLGKRVNKITSIVFTTHNSEESYIKEAINSILRQTNQDFEVLIMDDASNDKCAAMLDSIAVSDDRIQVFHQNENVGVSVNRNLGIEKAEGYYITFVDDDDYLCPKFLSKLVSEAETNDADIVTCNFTKKQGEQEIINPYNAKENAVYNTWEELEKVAATVIDPKTEGTDMQLLMLGSAWGKLYKREFLLHNKEVRFPVGMMGGEDAVFFIKALQAENPPILKMISDALYVYRKNEASYTVGYQPKLPEENLARIKKFYELSQGHILMEKATKRNACYAIIDMCSVYLSAPECPVENKKKFLKETLSLPEYQKALESLADLGYGFGKRLIYNFAKNGIVTPVILVGKVYRLKKRLGES